MRRILSVLAVFLLWAGVNDASAQERTITGTVLGSDNQPVSLALVQVVGGVDRTETNQDGRFRLTTRPGEVTLRVTSFGFRSRDVVVPAGQSEVEIRLETDALELEGIVVTGQQTSVARRNLANAVSTVSPTEIANAAPTQSPENLLQGRVAGALVEQNSGAPGGGMQVRLRGVSTVIGESEPLYVIDGVLMSNVAIPNNLNAVTESAGGSNASNQDAPVNRIADLNPADIERIEILKGASAAALYGSRAANGVIIITTRRGQPGAPRISMTQRFGTFQQSGDLDLRQWTREEALAAFGPTIGGFDVASAFGPDPDSRPLQTFDHQDQLTDDAGLSYETSLSVNGGDDDTRYFLAGSWRSDDGIIANTGFERQGLRLNLEQTLTERFRVNVHTNLTRTLAQRGVTNNDNVGVSYYMALVNTPNFVDLSQEEDVFPDNPFAPSNPLQTAALSQNDEEVWRFLGGVTGSFDAWSSNDGSQSVSLVSTLGIDYFTQENDLLFPPELEFEDDDGLLGTSLLSNSDNVNLSWTGNGVWQYGSDDFRSTATVGFQFNERELNISRISAFGLTAGQPNVNAGVVTSIVETRQEILDLGFFAQEEVLLLDERLFLTAGIRADRSSLNANTDEFFWYPKASASYRFDNLTDWLDGLKLRAAWGQSGNLPLFGQKFSPLTTTNNIGGISGVSIQGTVGAVDLQPEQQSEFEFGADLTAFDGRAQFTATVFQKNITDLLLQRTPAPSTGFQTEIFNAGELEVQGLELSLDAVPIQGDRFSWISRTTFYSDESEVVELPVPAFNLAAGFGTSLGDFRIEEGRSATQIVTNLGVDNDGNQIVGAIGDAVPDFRMGFSNEFTFGNFSVSSLFEWVEGHTLINLTRLLLDAGQNSPDFAEDLREREYIGAGTLTTGIGEDRLLDWALNGDSRGYFEDGSYIKLREARISYDIPVSYLSGILQGSIDGARITLSGRNLVTWTDYTGVDPEVSNFGNQPIGRNIDVAPFPPSRSFWLGVDVRF